jgi:sulfate adenylyltransferase subunit 2
MQITKLPRINFSPNNSLDLLGLDTPMAWNTERAFAHLQSQGLAGTKRTAERRMHELGLWPNELSPTLLKDEFDRPLNTLVLEKQLQSARSKRKLILFVQLHTLSNGHIVIHANNAKGGRYWVALDGVPSGDSVFIAIEKLLLLINKPVSLFPHGTLTHFFRAHSKLQELSSLTAYKEPFTLSLSNGEREGSRESKSKSKSKSNKGPLNKQVSVLPPHLVRLEAESIFIFREAVAQAKNPVMLYSIGKDSSVMLALAKKAFYPGKLPFPLLHIDTRWKFQAMYDMRNAIAQDPDITLLTHINPEAIAKNINPFDHGSAVHTDITKTEGLKQALDQYQFDAIFGGARRDEEKSRAKERIFSFRTKTHHWDPKNQRPELWNLFNTRIHAGESMRIFPLSNWTELDIWEYIYYQDIPVVPLYFAKERPIVNRNNLLLMVDDERFQLNENELIKDELVRFRTLGCYPLTGAIKSAAQTVPEIILELISARQTERQGRAIDSDANASMEKKKREGYF